LKGDLSTITVNGQRLRIAIHQGDGTRTPLLLMAGIGSSLEMLDPLVDEIDPALEIIRFDVPGTGGSPKPHYPYSLSAYAFLVARMLNQLGYSQIDVLGFSWGGGLAQQFAFQHAKLCRKLILSSTGTGATMIPGRLSAMVQLTMPWHFGEQFFMKEIASSPYSMSLRSDPELMREFTHAFYPTDLVGYCYQYWAVLRWSSMPWLWSLQQPTLILSGNQDPLVPLANAKIMQRLIPHARLYVYKGGHLGLITHSKELAGVIKWFLN
jgi:poly(3-hydroxyalkanoate) depolymerase